MLVCENVSYAYEKKKKFFDFHAKHYYKNNPINNGV